MNVSKTEAFDAKAFLAAIGEGRSAEDFAKDRVVFAQGDAAESIFYVQRGKIKIAIVSPRGKEAVLGIVGEGAFFGEGCLAGQPLRTSTASAMTDCSISRVSTAAMTRILLDEPSFSTLFIAHLLSRNIRIEEDLADQLFNSSEKRLARILLLLANFNNDIQPDVAIPKISQETLAEMVGTTRSRVSVFLNKFRKLGYIDYNERIHVYSSLVNVLLCE